MSDDSQRDDIPDPFHAMEEGTEELDQAALLRRLQADSKHTLPVQPVETRPPVHQADAFGFRRPPSDIRDTVQSPPVVQSTTPMPAKNAEPTQHYTVPESLLAQEQLPSRQIPTAIRNLPTIPIEAIVMDGEGTSTFSNVQILEFEAMVDSDGRIALSTSALSGHYRPGTRVKVVMVPTED